LAGKVAHDRIRFPQMETIFFLKRGDEPIRIHRKVSGLPVLSKRPANIDALVFKLELAHCPHGFLHVGGCFPAPDLDHRSFSFHYHAHSLSDRSNRHEIQSSRRASSGSMIGIPSRTGWASFPCAETGSSF